jgi:hypothetical protein
LKSHELIYRSKNRYFKNTQSVSLRCSRPLCSSQSTGGTPPRTPTRETRKRGPESQPPPPPRRAEAAPGPSGPNSVHVPNHHDPPFQTPKGRTQQNDQRSTPRHMFHP